MIIATKTDRKVTVGDAVGDVVVCGNKHHYYLVSAMDDPESEDALILVNIETGNAKAKHKSDMVTVYPLASVNLEGWQ